MPETTFIWTVAGRSVLLDESGRFLCYDQRSWHVILMGAQQKPLVVTCVRRRANIYAHRLVWERMGNTGPCGFRNGNSLDLRAANLVPARKPGRKPGSTVTNPAPSELGLWRHAMPGTGRPASYYEVCATEHDGWGKCPDRRIVGVIRRVSHGWQARLSGSSTWSEAVPRYFDAAALIHDQLLMAELLLA